MNVDVTLLVLELWLFLFFSELNRAQGGSVSGVDQDDKIVYHPLPPPTPIHPKIFHLEWLWQRNCDVFCIQKWTRNFPFHFFILCIIYVIIYTKCFPGILVDTCNLSTSLCVMERITVKDLYVSKYILMHQFPPDHD